MKKLYILIASLTLVVSAQAQLMLSTNITAGAGLHLLSTTRAKVYSIEVSSTNAFTYRFYDNDNVSNVPNGSTNGFYGTNFVNGAYISRSTYATNLLSQFTNYNGFVNYNTNVGLYTLTTTNAASTNAMPALANITTAGAETRVSYVDALFNRGVLIHTTGNGSITVYYRQE